MPTYTYSCETCGNFSVIRAVDTREEPVYCPGCAEPGRRVFETPYLTKGSAAVDRIVQRADTSAETPEVTSQIPPALRRSRSQERGRHYPPLPRP